MTNLLFVYGTLKGTKRPGLKYKNEAIINGCMYHLGWYPGVKTEGKGVVHGEVFEVIDNDAWRHLDAYEGVSAGLYKRIEVETLEGEKVQVYEYNGHVREESLVANGVWKPENDTIQ
jgi:gamma-glutamylcyclotransferase (GGCT)/AIG2-like uncharacterized protein YtfP